MMRGWQDDLNCVPDNLPFDQAGPSVRRVATQAGYGGPIVGRSNPIGFIFDAIRGFCVPASMTEDGNGGYTDNSGMGASSPDIALPYGDDGSGFGVYAGGGGGGYQGGGGSSIPPERSTAPVMMPLPAEMGMEAAHQCPSGASFNDTLGFCVPDILTGGIIEPMVTQVAFEPGGGGGGSCDKAPRNSARDRLRQAVASCDEAGAQQVLDYAKGCLMSKRSGSSGADTVRLIAEATAAIVSIKARCRAAEAVAGKSAMGAMGAMMGSRRPGLGGKLPSPVTSLSMTEGNARMRASAEPMGGAIDPSRTVTMPRRRPGVRR